MSTQLAQFEIDYANLVERIMDKGEYRETRNGSTFSLFAQSLTIDMSDLDRFPLLLGRKMFYTGVLGEFAAMIRGPVQLKDFEVFGCNYWKQWAKPDGSINVDYGNTWINFNGVDQVAEVLDKLKNNPTDRRLLVTGWKPDNLEFLDLPCCHYSYQWYVRKGEYLDMIWNQRSADTMIGIPSDIVLAAVWNIAMAIEAGLKPGKITMHFGDTHIYEEHLAPALVYVQRVKDMREHGTGLHDKRYPKYSFDHCPNIMHPVFQFMPEMLDISEYVPMSALKFLLKE